MYVIADLYDDISSEEDLNHDDRIIEKETDFDHLDDISLDDFPDVDEDFVSNIVGDTDGDIRSVIYSDMPIEGEHCVFDLLYDVPFECKNNSADEEDVERRGSMKKTMV